MENFDQYLNSNDSLHNVGKSVTGFEFDVQNERGAVGNVNLKNASISTAKIGTAQITSAEIANAAITNAKLATASIGTANIGTLSFNQISGGTAILGGTLNGNGVVSVKLSNGDEYFRVDGGTFVVKGDDAASNLRFVPGDNIVFVRTLEVGGTNGGGTQDGIFSHYGVGTFETVRMDDVALRLKRGNFFEFRGTTTPPTAGTTNTCRLYLDSSGGKNRLMGIFNTGTAVQIAIEP